MAISEQALREMISAALDSWSEANPEEFVLWYTEDVLAVDSSNPVPYRGREQLLEYFRDFKKTFGTFSMKLLHLELVTPNALYYEFVMTYAREGEEKQHMIFRLAVVFEEVDGGFLVRFEQWDMNPSDAQGNRLG